MAGKQIQSASGQEEGHSTDSATAALGSAASPQGPRRSGDLETAAPETTTISATTPDKDDFGKLLERLLTGIVRLQDVLENTTIDPRDFTQVQSATTDVLHTLSFVRQYGVASASSTLSKAGRESLQTMLDRLQIAIEMTARLFTRTQRGNPAIDRLRWSMRSKTEIQTIHRYLDDVKSGLVMTYQILALQNVAGRRKATKDLTASISIHAEEIHSLLARSKADINAEAKKWLPALPDESQIRKIAVRVGVSLAKHVNAAWPHAEIDRVISNAQNTVYTILPEVAASPDLTTSSVGTTSPWHLIFCPSGGSNSHSDMTIPTVRSDFESLARLLCLPSKFSKYLGQAIPRVEVWEGTDGFFKQGLLARSPIAYPQSAENWTLSLSWSPDHTKVAGLIVGFREEDIDQVRMYLQVESQRKHTLQIPLILMDAVLERDASELRRVGQSLFGVESQTRLYSMSTDTEGNTSSDIDFDSMIKTLNAVQNQLAFVVMRLNGFVELVDRIKGPILKQQQGRGGSREALLDHAAKVRADAASLLKVGSYHQRVAQNQLDVVFAMVSQRESKAGRDMNAQSMKLTELSVDIAATTKADSKAMKTLAIVSTVFLPGTFVSALFSMGMFEWTAPRGQKVVSDRFWIYWVITVPLTLIVIAGFWFFLWVSVDEKDDQGPVSIQGTQMRRRAETPFQGLKRRRTQRIANMEKTEEERQETV